MLIFSVAGAYADQGRIISVYVIGSESCASLLGALSKVPIDERPDYGDKSYTSISRLYSEWPLSFVSTFKMFNQQQEAILNADRHGVTLWAKNWCQKHPMSNVSDGAWALVIEQSGFDLKFFK